MCGGGHPFVGFVATVIRMIRFGGWASINIAWRGEAQNFLSDGQVQNERSPAGGAGRVGVAGAVGVGRGLVVGGDGAADGIDQVTTDA